MQTKKAIAQENFFFFFLEQGKDRLKDLRDSGIDLLVGMSCTSTAVGVASVPTNKQTNKSWDDAAGAQLLSRSDWSGVNAYGAMMARAGLLVDCALESQSSSCAFSWDPIVRGNKLTWNYKRYLLSILIWPNKSWVCLSYYCYYYCLLLPLWPVCLFCCCVAVKAVKGGDCA